MMDRSLGPRKQGHDPQNSHTVHRHGLQRVETILYDSTIHNHPDSDLTATIYCRLIRESFCAI